jgi:hypothetical protein
MTYALCHAPMFTGCGDMGMAPKRGALLCGLLAALMASHITQSAPSVEQAAAMPRLSQQQVARSVATMIGDERRYGACLEALREAKGRTLSSGGSLQRLLSPEGPAGDEPTRGLGEGGGCSGLHKAMLQRAEGKITELFKDHREPLGEARDANSPEWPQLRKILRKILVPSTRGSTEIAALQKKVAQQQSKIEELQARLSDKESSQLSQDTTSKANRERENRESSGDREFRNLGEGVASKMWDKLGFLSPKQKAVVLKMITAAR